MAAETDKLNRLQELEITLKESQIVHGDDAEASAPLRGQIEVLRSQIDEAALTRYDRLSRHGLAVVRVLGGMCMGCNITIPQGDINRMKSGKIDPVCPHCDRFVVF